jgi:hypothetical protein
LVDQPVTNTPDATGVVTYSWSAADIGANGILDAALPDTYQALVWWVVTSGALTQDVNEAVITIAAHSPLLKSYVELEEFRSTTELTSRHADDDIRVALVAASRGIEQALDRRTFFKDAADTTRYYTAPRWAWSSVYRNAETPPIEIDDVVSITSLVTSPAGDGTYSDAWTEGTHYVLDPRNAPSDGYPYTGIRRLSTSTLLWPGWADAIKITGRFGWPAVPAGVKTLTTLVAERLVRRTREAPFGIIAVGLEGAAVRASQLANDPEYSWLKHNLERDQVLVRRCW